MLRADSRERVERARGISAAAVPMFSSPNCDLVRDAGEDDLVLGILEDGRDRAGQLGRPCVARVAAADLDPAVEAAAVEMRNEPGERAQQRRLARPGRPEQRDQLALLELERDVAQRRAPVAGYVNDRCSTALEPQHPRDDDERPQRRARAGRARPTAGAAPASRPGGRSRAPPSPPRG